jgi:hypothetical protein
VTSPRPLAASGALAEAVWGALYEIGHDPRTGQWTARRGKTVLKADDPRALWHLIGDHHLTVGGVR